MARHYARNVKLIYIRPVVFLQIGPLRLGRTMANGRAQRQRLHLRGGAGFHAHGNQRHRRSLSDDWPPMGRRHVLSGRLVRQRFSH